MPLALFTLVSLSALVLAFLSMGGMEPQISRNLSDSTQARYAAEAGLEAAFDTLASAPGGDATVQGSWKNLLSKNAVASSNPAAHWLTAANGAATTLPGLAATFGTYTIQIRNDSLATDQSLTGVLPELGVTNDDNNGVVIVTAAGTHNGVTRQIQAAMRRLALPPFPAAFSMPGAQVDVGMGNNNSKIDGRDYVYQCVSKCTDPDPKKQTWDYVLNSDQKNMKFGFAVQPGNQQNLSPATSYEANAEAGLDKNVDNVRGKSQSGGSGDVNGKDTVAPDSSLGGLITRASRDGLDTETTPKVLDDFLTNLQKFSSTTVLQSSLSCAQNDPVSGKPVGIWMNGNSSDPSKPTLSGCVNQTVDLGDRNNPKLVYFRGDRDPTSGFVGVLSDGQPIKGAGILIIEDGDFRVRNQFDWDGVVIVTGRYVTFWWENSSKGSVNGAGVSNETMWNESGNLMGVKASGTLYDALFDGANSIDMRYSQQTLNMVQRALLFRMTTWREI